MSHSASELFLHSGLALVAFTVLYGAARARLARKEAVRDDAPLD